MSAVVKSPSDGNTEGKVYSGGEILKNFFKEPETRKIIVKHEGKSLEFIVKPMDNDTYVQMSAKLKNMNDFDDDEDQGLRFLETFGEHYYPAMKIIFPKCCINPKVSLTDRSDALQISRLPISVCSDLFLKILSMSGLTADSSKEIKK